MALPASAINLTPSQQSCADQAAIVSMSPTAVVQGQSKVVLTVTGSLLHYSDVTLDFGAGISVVTRQQIQSRTTTSTTYTLTVSIAQTAPAGPHPVTIVYCGGKRKPSGVSLVVTPPAQTPLVAADTVVTGAPCSERAMITSAITPQSLAQGQMNAKLVFTGYQLEAPDVTLDFGSGIVLLGRPVKQPGLMDLPSYSLNVNVLPTAPVGPRPVSVRYCGGKVRQTKASVNILPAPAAQLPAVQARQQTALPAIVSMAPNQWEAGRTYTLTLAGSNLLAGMEVRFGEGVKNKGKLNVMSPTTAQIDVEIDPAAKGQRTAEILTAANQQWIRTNATAFIREAARTADEDDGTFRGKWWNYYDRGLSSADSGDLKKALEDLLKAASMREKDQRMARTYGMHFTDYFPHRELGIVYYRMGDLARARAELEASLRSAESAKASHFLNRVRKEQLVQQTAGKVKPPLVVVDAPSAGIVTRASSIEVRGRAAAEGLVAQISVNGKHYRFDTARHEVPFRQSVMMNDGENRIAVRAEDLLGNSAEKSVSVIVDREGPVISILDVAADDKSGKPRVRVVGEVSDNTGIREVLINGKRTAVNSRREFEFDVAFDRRDLRNRVVISATDRADNETSAELDISRELKIFTEKPARVQYAFNSAALFSSDKELPLIRLKDSGDVPAAYVDRYYVDGEISDNTKVEKVVVNGVEVPNRKGRRVFFSRMVGLKEGKNRISVEAYDSSGNRAVTEFTVTRNVPEVLQTGSRMSVTVLPFELKQKSAGVADLAYDYLVGSFVDQKRFSVVEREKLEQVLKEQKIAKSKLSDPEHTIRVGKLMSAEAILATSIREDAKSVEIVTRVINTETSEVMEVKDVFSEEKGSAAVRELMEGLAAKVASGFPVVEGIVIRQDGKELVSDIGDSEKVRKGTGVIVYRKGKEIKHPVTGKSLGWDTVKLAEGRLEEVHRDFSKIRLLDKSGSSAIAVKDLIITK